MSLPGAFPGQPQVGIGPALGMPPVSSPLLSTDYATGWLTNVQIPYSLHPRRYKNHMMTTTQLYHVLVATKDSRTPPSEMGRFEDSDPSHTLMNVPAFNLLRAKTEMMTKPGERIKSATEVWHDCFALVGIVRSDVGTDDVSLPTNGYDYGMERKITFVLQGPQLTFNGWGAVTAGTKLYLILKKEKIDKHFVVRPTGEQEILYSRTPKNLTDRPFQLSFWADPDYDAPPDDALMYDDENDDSVRGEAIPVGTVQRGAGDEAYFGGSKSLNTDFAALSAQPQIWVFQDL